MKIILGGGGDEILSYKSHKFFYEKLSNGTKLLYIPVALLGEKHSAESCLEWFKYAFNSFNVESIDMLVDLNGTLTNELNKYDGIYLGGGNTYKLLKEIYESGFDKKLVKYLHNNGVVYGGSAGAIIFGKSINTALFTDKNVVGLLNTDGLNLIGGNSIWCHYSDGDDKNIIQLVNEGLDIIAISEDSAVYVEGNKIEIIGKNVKLFN